jgi:hypothetical protein
MLKCIYIRHKGSVQFYLTQSIYITKTNHLMTLSKIVIVYCKSHTPHKYVVGASAEYHNVRAVVHVFLYYAV